MSKLGNLKVKDLMTKEVITTDPNQEVVFAFEKLMKEKISSMPVIDNNKMVGIVTATDLGHNLILDNYTLGTKVVDVMVKQVAFVNPENSIIDAINEINNNTKLIDNVYVSLQNIFEWPSNANSNSDGYCLGGNSHIGILSDGSVVICCLDGEGESNLGNIFYEDLSFILNSEKYHNIINYFKNNKCYLDICKKCTYKNRFK